MTMISPWQKGHVPQPHGGSMNSDHEIEVTEETSAAAEAIESASETVLDHAATAVEAADLSDEDEDGDDEEGDDEDGEESDEDDADDAVKAEGDDAEGEEESEDGEAEEDDDKEEAA
ncbi:ATPase [Mesorhizobium sp.]|uniref:ATPase n=1 Tax=unclassified Mesorhizobium TaxID=325217 RepID=UPI00345BDD92